MHRLALAHGDVSGSATGAKRQFVAPRLTEFGTLTAFTKMDGIGHNGSVISGQAAP